MRAADGTVLRRLPALEYPSLGAGLLAGGRGNHIEGYDPVTGERRFRIRNGFGPLVLPRKRVVFLADRLARRDPQENSVWIRSPAGRIRKLVQFSNGPGMPGISTGLDAVTVLSVSADAAGDTLAVVEGNDVDLFHYDIWVVDVKTGSAFRATTGGRSVSATLDPAGERLAYLREEGFCGGPAPGYRAGDVLVEEARPGAAPEVLLDGTCEVFYSQLGWLSAEELIAIRVTRTAPETFRADLVRVDVPTATVTVLDGTGDALAPSVSPALRLVGYMHGTGEGEVLDVDTGRSLELPDSFAPQISRDGSWP